MNDDILCPKYFIKVFREIYDLFVQGVPRNMTFKKSLFLVKTSFWLIIFYFEINFNMAWLPFNIFIDLWYQTTQQIMEKDILNYSPTVMFRGKPCSSWKERPLFVLCLCAAQPSTGEFLWNKVKSSEVTWISEAKFVGVEGVKAFWSKLKDPKLWVTY